MFISELESPNKPPRQTTPTWEIELLISAAVVFALVQCLEPLEAWFVKWMSLVSADRESLVAYTYIYGKVVLFVLIIAFVLHLAARAVWVALIGLHTVFPKGPIWENMTVGPIARRLLREEYGDLGAAIQRADNRSSLVFGYGILAAQYAIVVFLLSMFALILAMLLRPVIDSRALIYFALAALLAPYAAVGALDKWCVPRLAPENWLVQWVERGLRWSSRLLLLRTTMPLLPMIVTNVGGRRGTWLLVALLSVAIAIVIFDSNARLNGGWPLRARALTELSRSRGVFAAHYASLRDEVERYRAVPYIPSEVVEGPYIRLFVPFVSARHEQAMSETCSREWRATDKASERKVRSAASPTDPTANAGASSQDFELEERGAEERLMDCFGALLDIRLDDSPASGLRLERYRDSFSGHDGGLAMIDARRLTTGRHDLSIARLPIRGGMFSEATATVEPPDRIVFWR